MNENTRISQNNFNDSDVSKSRVSKPKKSVSKIPKLNQKSKNKNSEIESSKEKSTLKTEESIIYMSDSLIDPIEDKLNDEFETISNECKNLEKYLRRIRREIKEQKEVHENEIRIYETRIKALMMRKNKKKTENPLPWVSSESIEENTTNESDYKIASLESIYTGKSMDENEEMDEITFEKALIRKHKNFEDRKKEMKLEFEKQRLEEVAAANNEMSNAIQETEMANATELEQLKSYYQQITKENLQKIQSLKSEIARLKPEDKIQTKVMKEYTQQKKGIEDSLKELEKDGDDLSQKLEEAEETRKELESVQNKVAFLEDEKENYEIALEVLSKRFLELEEERDDLYEKFESTIQDVRQRTEFRGFILEQKIKEMNDKLEQKERALQMQVASKRMEGSDISKSFNDALINKNAQIEQLESKLMQMHYSYEKMIDMYESKLNKFNKPNE